MCLFTCLTTRAVNPEVAEGIDLEEFLLCLVQFVSLKGKPKVVYSDNGPNLVAEEQELGQVLEELVEQHQEFHAKPVCQ